MANFDERKAAWVTNADCYRLPDYLGDNRGEDAWKTASGTWMGHKVDSGRTLLRTALYARFQTDSLLEMIEKESVGKDAVTDLLLVNFKTPDYVTHQYGPESKEAEEAIHALDSELARVLSALDDAAGPGHTVVAITADHGMPPEPKAPDQARHFVEDVEAAVSQKFDPEGHLVLDFSDPANCQMYVNLDRMAELKLTLDDIAAFLEDMPFIRFAFTEDQVRAARVR
jgi:predicted AlkP superfamily pyrophosphatase or phosphodiesterase